MLDPWKCSPSVRPALETIGRSLYLKLPLKLGAVYFQPAFEEITTRRYALHSPPLVAVLPRNFDD